jgi:hypothetical protein
MRNYGFNYLVEKVYLINEDRANVWRTYFPKFGEFYKEVSGKIKKDGGVTSSGHVREKTIEYLMVNLLDIFKYGSNYSEYTKKVCKVAPGQRRESFTDGFNKWMDMGKWSWSPQKEKEYALFTIVEKHGDAILSPEIKNKFLDKNNIIEYLDAPSDQGIKKSIIGDDEVDTPEEIEYILKKGEKNYKNQSDVAKQRLKLFLKNRTEISPEDSQYIKSKPKGFSLDGVEWLDEFQIKELLRKNEKKVEKKSSMGRRIPKTSHAALIENERLRHFMDETKPELGFSPTSKQIKSFEGTEYGKPENVNKLKETIVARILTGDASAGDVTPEQKKAADSIRQQWEKQSKPKTMVDMVSDAIKMRPAYRR